MPNVRAFAIVALAPAGLIALGALLGEVWIWVALAYMTLFAWGLDKLISETGAVAGSYYDPGVADRLAVLLAITHFLLLGLTVGALPPGTGRRRAGRPAGRPRFPSRAPGSGGGAARAGRSI